MEINKQPSQGPRIRRSGDGIDITRLNRDGIQKVVEELEAGQVEELRSKRAPELASAARSEAGDQIEVSEEAKQLLARAGVGAPKQDEARQARLQELKTRYLEGTLNTPELVDQTASKLLGG
jgi:hypothetical protein